MSRQLILGGIRSGKSRLAEQAITRLMPAEKGRITYVATAEAGDGEMAQRISRHQARRPADWSLVEAPQALAPVLHDHARAEQALLIDCMSLWVSNLLHAGEAVFKQERAAFLEALSVHPGPVVVVSNEVGLGLVGMDSLSRRFADELGALNQDLAQSCEQVWMAVAGLPLQLKGAESGA